MSSAAAAMAKRKAEAARERAAAAPVTTVDLADVESALRAEFRAELRKAGASTMPTPTADKQSEPTAPVKKPAGAVGVVVGAVLLGLVVVAIAAAVILRRK